MVHPSHSFGNESMTSTNFLLAEGVGESRSGRSYYCDEIVTNEKGEEIIYRLKEGIRFKPLEYLCEDMDIEIMEEVKQT